MRPKVDDRLIMAALTVAVLVGYLVTRDPVLADQLKYCIGGLFGVLIARANKQLVVTTTDEQQTKQILADFSK